MSLKDFFNKLFHRKAAPEQKTEQSTGSAPAAGKPQRLKKTCKNCGKTFSYDPAWDHIPNYCRDCREQFIREKEEKQRAGEPKKIRRKCRECGRFFSFPSTLEHYPRYCSNCRKQHKAAMKARFSRGKGEQAGS